VLSNSAGGLYLLADLLDLRGATSLDYRRNRSPNVSEHHRTYSPLPDRGALSAERLKMVLRTSQDARVH